MGVDRPFLDLVDLVDRLVRRIGYWHAAQRQWQATPEPYRRLLAAYADGINAGNAQGLPRRAHEFSLLRSEPGRWTPVEVLAFVKVIASALSTNWDTELARLIVASGDGLDALMDCDPGCDPDHVVTSPPGTAIGPSLARAASVLSTFVSFGSSRALTHGGDETILALCRKLFDRAVIEPVAASLDRRSALTLNVMDGQLYLESPAGSHTLALTPTHFA